MLEQAEPSERSLAVRISAVQAVYSTPARKPLPSLRTLVSRMSHDIRTPLAAILANAEFLALADLSEGERNEIYDEIRLSVDWMSELVSYLLECSKGEEVLRPAIGNIVETTKRVVRMIGVRLAFRRITITHRHEGSAVGWYNASLMEQAISNICPECLRSGVSRVGSGRDHHIGRARLLAN